jgi:hypothetical protein
MIFSTSCKSVEMLLIFFLSQKKYLFQYSITNRGELPTKQGKV